jgi:hypothetical protein
MSLSFVIMGIVLVVMIVVIAMAIINAMLGTV